MNDISASRRGPTLEDTGVLSLRREHPIDVHFLLGPHINMPVNDSRNVEAKCHPCLVASSDLIAVIKLVCNVRGIGSMQHRCSVRRIPTFRTYNPSDPVLVAISG